MLVAPVLNHHVCSGFFFRTEKRQSEMNIIYWITGFSFFDKKVVEFW